MKLILIFWEYLVAILLLVLGKNAFNANVFYQQTGGYNFKFNIVMSAVFKFLSFAICSSNSTHRKL